MLLKMRYLVQFLIPALIVVVVVYMAARVKRGPGEADAESTSNDTATFILILVVVIGPVMYLVPTAADKRLAGLRAEAHLRSPYHRGDAPQPESAGPYVVLTRTRCA